MVLMTQHSLMRAVGEAFILARPGQHLWISGISKDSLAAITGKTVHGTWTYRIKYSENRKTAHWRSYDGDLTSWVRHELGPLKLPLADDQEVRFCSSREKFTRTAQRLAGDQTHKFMCAGIVARHEIVCAAGGEEQKIQVQSLTRHSVQVLSSGVSDSYLACPTADISDIRFAFGLRDASRTASDPRAPVGDRLLLSPSVLSYVLSSVMDLYVQRGSSQDIVLFDSLVADTRRDFDDLGNTRLSEDSHNLPRRLSEYFFQRWWLAPRLSLPGVDVRSASRLPDLVDDSYDGLIVSELHAPRLPTMRSSTRITLRATSHVVRNGAPIRPGPELFLSWEPHSVLQHCSWISQPIGYSEIPIAMPKSFAIFNIGRCFDVRVETT